MPDGENWEGSPARRVERPIEPLPPRPPVGRLARLAQSAFFVVAGMAVAAMFFMTVFPGFILIDWIDANSWNLFEEGNETYPLVAFWFYFLLSIPASLVLMTLTVFLAAGLRRLFLPRQKAGTFSIYGLTYCRTWLLNRVLGQQPGRAARHLRLDVRPGLAAVDGRARSAGMPRSRPPWASCPTCSRWATTRSSPTA